MSQKALVKIYYVYMVLCADHSFYAGITNNAEYRVNQHNYGEDPECYRF
jgi:putative endonuclease